MKNFKLFFLLCVMGLVGCTQQPDVNKAKTITSTTTQVEQSVDTALTEKKFQTFVEGKEVPILSSESKETKLAPASNGVVETSIDGKEKIRYRKYPLPLKWELHPRTRDAERDVVYQISKNSQDFIVQLYTLDAYNESPLNDGEILTKKELAQRLRADGHKFIYETEVLIAGEKWQVGYEEVPDNNVMGLVFYRLENTGNFDDSVLVASILCSHNVLELGGEEPLKEVIGQVKTILKHVSQREADPQS